MCQSPSRDFTPASTSLKASLPGGVSSSASAPRKRQFKQRPFVRREIDWHWPQTSGSPRIANVESGGGCACMTLRPVQRSTSHRGSESRRPRSLRIRRSWQLLRARALDSALGNDEANFLPTARARRAHEKVPRNKSQRVPRSDRDGGLRRPGGVLCFHIPGGACATLRRRSPRPIPRRTTPPAARLRFSPTVEIIGPALRPSIFPTKRIALGRRVYAGGVSRRHR